MKTQLNTTLYYIKYSSMQCVPQGLLIVCNFHASWKHFFFYSRYLCLFLLSSSLEGKTINIRKNSNETVKSTTAFTHTWLCWILETVSTNGFRKPHGDSTAIEWELDEFLLWIMSCLEWRISEVRVEHC